MQITVHPMLQAPMRVLDLPFAARRSAILEMLRPFAPMLRRIMPEDGDPITMFGFLRLEGPVVAEFGRGSAPLGVPPYAGYCTGFYLRAFSETQTPYEMQVGEGWDGGNTQVNTEVRG